MAAYAALTSLMNLIDQINHHPQPPVTLHKEQTQSLTEKIIFLQDFHEAYNRHYSSQEVERLRTRIADAAYAAEDVIESHIVDQILAKRDQTSSAGLYQSQQRAQEYAEDSIESFINRIFARRPADQEVIESPMTDEVLARRPDNDNKGKKKYLQKVKQYFGFVKSYVTKCNSQSQSTNYGEKTSSANLYQSQQKAITETTSTHDEADKICSAYLYQGLQKVLEEMDLVKKDVEKIKEKLGTQEQLQRIIATPVSSPRSPSTQHNIMVVFDDVLNELLHKLTGQPRSDLQIIPISGMGGIGKTTLAKDLYTRPLVEQHFDILVWVTISQEYNMKEILIEVLCQKNHGSREVFSQMGEAQLGEKLYQNLYGRRYLIVMDDMWSNDVWDKVKFCFPRNNQGSRIIVTTRLSNVAYYLSSGGVHEMNFLDQDQSWSLFCKSVFGEKDCPPELEEIGMEIAKNCKGLPLSIVVLGGLLAKSIPTREYWAHILQNVSSIVNSEESERSLKILHMSYDELPVYLRACFLYMAIFPEDSKIRVSELISMWVAEGFLKPISGKSLEESGEEYLMDLIDRNLILVCECEYSAKIKFCKIHDLLRDLCIREARKERFVFFTNQHDHEGINTHRRIVIDKNISNMEYLQNLQSISAARSLICYSHKALPAVEGRLLRVFIYPEATLGWADTFQQVNLRYFAVDLFSQFPKFATLVSFLWNLQTLIISEWQYNFAAPLEIWKMPLLRHVECMRLILPEPPSGDTEEFVLHNLHTLMVVILKLDEEVVKRIPNVKKLKLKYDKASDFPSSDNLLRNPIFPHSLKELCLWETRLSWEDIDTKIGSLPHLQALKLSCVSCTTSEWETIQGHFCSLKKLSIDGCRGWEYWSTESSHFPRLEHLVLDYLPTLREIPSDIGNIPTLASIQLRHCRFSAIKSAKQIAEEQEELGNEGLRVTVTLSKSQSESEVYRSVESLASHNFQVIIEQRDFIGSPGNE